MMKDIIIVIGFIVFVFVVCKLWNMYAMEKYKDIQKRALKLVYGCYINSIGRVKLAGTGSDGNGDYDVSKAIKKIELPGDTRIRA